MATKLGNGGHGQENYDPNTGKYADDGVLNKSERTLNINQNELNDNLYDFIVNGGGMSDRLFHVLKLKKINTKGDFIEAITKPDFMLEGKKSYREAMKIGDFISKNNRFPTSEEWEQMDPWAKPEEEKNLENLSNNNINQQNSLNEEAQAMRLFKL